MGSAVNTFRGSDVPPVLVVRRPTQMAPARRYNKKLSVVLQPQIEKAPDSTRGSVVEFYLATAQTDAFASLRETLPAHVSIIVRRVTVGVCSNPLPVQITVTMDGLDGSDGSDGKAPLQITLPAACNDDVNDTIYALHLREDMLLTFAGVTVAALNEQRMRPFVESYEGDEERNPGTVGEWDFLNREELLYRFIDKNRELLAVLPGDVRVNGVATMTAVAQESDPEEGDAAEGDAAEGDAEEGDAGDEEEEEGESDEEEKEEKEEEVRDSPALRLRAPGRTEDVSDAELLEIAAVRRTVCDRSVDRANQDTLRHIRYTDTSKVSIGVTKLPEQEGVLIAAVERNPLCAITLAMDIEYVVVDVDRGNDGMNYFV